MIPILARQWLTLSVADVLLLNPSPIREELLSRTALRPYQFDLLRAAAALMQLGVRRILIQLPTGGGKTVMASEAMGSAAAQDMRSQFIVHRKELIDQTSKTFFRGNLNHGFIAAGRPFEPEALAILSGVQTLVNRLDQVLPPLLIIIDEAHHATAGTWARVLEEYPNAFVIGLTATPERLDGQGLEDKFDVLLCGPSVADLIDCGYLSPFNYYAPHEPELVGVHSVAGDFNRGELGAAMDKPQLVGDIVQHKMRLVPGAQGIVFASSREHSRHIVDAFQGAGVRAAHVDGSLPDKERHHIVNAFRDGAIEVMSNVDLFGEGFDVPGIVYVGLARPTKSLSLYMQQVGRALRVLEGKTEAVIADHAGNVFRHGMPDDERTWSLQGRAKQARGGPNDATPIRQCAVCYRVVPSIVKVCPGCDTPFPENSRRMIGTKAGQLSKVDREALKRAASVQRKQEWDACTSYGDFKRLAEERGYEDPPKWAQVQWKLKKGRLPYRRKGL